MLKRFTLGSCETMTLQGFSFGSVAEILDGGAEDEEDAGEVGFRFGDSYDFGAGEARFTKRIFKGVSDEATVATTVETDSIEVLIKAYVAGEDDMAGAAAIWVIVCVVFWRAVPVPDGEVGPCCPRSDAAEAEHTGESIKVDDRVRAEGEQADIFVESSAHGQCASTESDGCIVTDGVCGGDEEGAAGDIDHCAVAHGSGGGGLEGAARDGGGAGVGVSSGQRNRARGSFIHAVGSGEDGAHGAVLQVVISTSVRQCAV